MNDIVKSANEEYAHRYNQLKDILTVAYTLYKTHSCPCAFPRFQQIAGIDCSKTHDSFVCRETELLIHIVKPGFTISKSDLKDEILNEKWTCNTCGSDYEFGWSDFSISVNRVKLKLNNLKCAPTGLPATTPIPLYLGLYGHNYPSQAIMAPVSFDTFKKYILEQ